MGQVTTTLEAIDRPIRGLVCELNRIGLKTVWSCCGFSYKGEEEAKSHSKVPFVTFETPQTQEQMSNFFRLGSITQACGWVMHAIYQDQWRLFIANAEHKAEGWVPGKEQLVAIHDYEEKLIRIVHLTEMIKLKLPTVNETVTLEDGNLRQIRIYPLIADEWQIVPKKTSVINDY